MRDLESANCSGICRPPVWEHVLCCDCCDLDVRRTASWLGAMISRLISRWTGKEPMRYRRANINPGVGCRDLILDFVTHHPSLVCSSLVVIGMLVPARVNLYTSIVITIITNVSCVFYQSHCISPQHTHTLSLSFSLSFSAHFHPFLPRHPSHQRGAHYRVRPQNVGQHGRCCSYSQAAKSYATSRGPSEKE